MRIPRKSFLPQNGGLVHKFWRAHNREFLLCNNKTKEMYLEYTFQTLTHPKINPECINEEPINPIEIHSYCVMSNHSHQMITYKGNSDSLSNFMRISHGKFGQRFNKLHKRQGPVAYERPKTPLVQSKQNHQMRLQFYIEANPLRAKITKNLKMYRFSSFGYYAWGRLDSFSKNLTPPKWYMELGPTPTARQKKYRSLFESYLQETMKRSPEFSCSHFIGDTEWICMKNPSKIKKTESSQDPPPNSFDFGTIN